jgi:restriction endonuclease S subunit
MNANGAGWKELKLGSILRYLDERLTIDDEKEYLTITVKRRHGGLEIREKLFGHQIATKKQFRLVPGAFIISRVQCWHQAYAIVGDVLTNTIASTNYDQFAISPEVDPRFFWWLSYSPAFTETVRSSAVGVVIEKMVFNRDRWLTKSVWLPPLAEQRRMVARIDEMAAQIHEAHTLRHESAEEAEALHLSVLHQHFVAESSSWDSMPMEEAIEINDKQVDPTLPEHARLPHISGENMETKTCRLLPWRSAEADGVKSNNYLFGPETILYSKIRPYLRKAVFVDFRGVCSADIYPVRVKSPKLDPHFVKWSLVAEPFTEYANRLSGRTRMPKLNRKQLFGFRFTHPPLAEQRRIVAELNALQAEVESLKRLQAETASELDALLPSILDKAFKGEL